MSFLARHVNGIVVVPRESLATFRQPIAKTRPENFTLRVAAQQRLRHDHELGAGGANLLFEREDVLQGLGFSCADEPICSAATFDLDMVFSSMNVCVCIFARK